MKKIAKFFKQFFLINDTPSSIAGGAALGIFLGISPGEGVATALILASLFKLNRLAAMAGVLATNMWSTVVVMPLAATVGGFLFGESSANLIENFNKTYHLGLKFFLSKAILFDIALPLVVGFFVVAGLVSVLAYGLIFLLIKIERGQAR
ncbi:MAG: hypothetical protein US25_C0005G0014 [Candidatus Moranbacteria bacterium GW2011_GWE1_36_7]|nr:MAG: hypothetical protein UR99_C0008G0008 [Candidatus Moranbacteria bacterium GW2011_GWD2_36_12]KKQ06840.1 MAG: hypothetical protein US16_C0008G0017 [Candidatus Moranbacteria bacterium GW2011_GWE2_36_40]KKQ15430.1 MAG: hypothetical protein US25_C0005G0014 [Candidatus Moranbacteria bacterium GW2011_GWE1_36_7]